MPIKLICTLALVVLVAVLTGFNLSNKCDIWFFHTFKDIPVFAALLGSFILGVIVTLPFTFKKKRGSGAGKAGKTPDKSQRSHRPVSSLFRKSRNDQAPAGEPSVSDADYVPPEKNNE